MLPPPFPGRAAVPWVLVFEAPIDLMSFCTLHREVRSNAVALCGSWEGGVDELGAAAARAGVHPAISRARAHIAVKIRPPAKRPRKSYARSTKAVG